MKIFWRGRWILRTLTYRWKCFFNHFFGRLRKHHTGYIFDPFSSWSIAFYIGSSSGFGSEFECLYNCCFTWHWWRNVKMEFQQVGCCSLPQLFDSVWAWTWWMCVLLRGMFPTRVFSLPLYADGYKLIPYIEQGSCLICLLGVQLEVIAVICGGLGIGARLVYSGDK